MATRATGESVWLSALQGDSVDLVRALVSGANVDHIGARGGSALFAAAARGHQDATRILLAYGADTELQTDSTWRALMVAAQEGHHVIVGLLLRHGADAAAINHNGHCALDIARDAGYRQCIDLLEGVGASLTPILIAAHTLSSYPSFILP